MSSIKLESNASGTGTLTIAAPNTNTDYTLTLPTAAGTVQVSGAAISGTTGSFSGDLSFNSGYGSAAVAYGCRAWVNFDGTTNTGGFCTIRASGNVTSVADNGTGNYTVNFATAMPDANYAVAGIGENTSAGSSAQSLQIASDSVPTASSCRIYAKSGTSGNRDQVCLLSFFR